MNKTETKAQNGANYDPLEDAIRRSTQEVELSGFGDGKPWTVTLKKISVLEMARCGTIPNPLMKAVTELYTKGTIAPPENQDGALPQAAEIMRLFAQAALVKPTFEELEAAGVQLTDTQLTEIFIYEQRGAEVLRLFRQASGVPDAVQDSAAVSDKTEQPA